MTDQSRDRLTMEPIKNLVLMIARALVDDPDGISSGSRHLAGG